MYFVQKYSVKSIQFYTAVLLGIIETRIILSQIQSLSFSLNGDNEEDENEDEEEEICIPTKKIRKNPDVDTSFLPDREREEQETRLREELRQVIY